MENRYVITPDGTFISETELYHHGIKGMKWGVRRYQNEDGSLTPAGRKRYTNPDGTLNKKGKKYIAKETERLKAERTRLENQKKTDAELGKLDAMRKSNQSFKDQVDGKSDAQGDENSSSQKISGSKRETYSMNLMSDKEINDTANRLTSEDRLKDLLTKRGYNVSLDEKSEIDNMIDSLSKEKRVAELKADVEKLSRGKTEIEKRIEILQQRRDVAKLEKEIRDYTPKKESKLSKFMNSKAGQNIADQLIKSGENVLTNYFKSKNGDGSNDKKNDGKNDKSGNNNNKPGNNSNNKPNENDGKNDKSGNNNNKPGNNSNNKPNKNDGGTGKNSNSNSSKITEDTTRSAVKAVGNAMSKTLGKEAKKISKSIERQQARKAENESKQAARELDNLITRASKNSDASYYNSKAYEKKVDKMLAEMDDRAWEIYYSRYANR